MRMSEKLEIDTCPACEGVWLDRSEVYQYVSRPTQVYEQFKTAYQGAAQSGFSCPRCGVPMLQASIGPKPLTFEACPRCGGNWFDKGEIQGLNWMLDTMEQQATGQGGEYTQLEVGPRQPSAEELADWTGPDAAPLYALIAAALSVGLVLAVVAPARSLLPAAGIGAALLMIWWIVFSFKRWYLSGAVLIGGEIAGYGESEGSETEVRVHFYHDEYPFQVSRVITRGTPLDLKPGSRIGVLVNSFYPRGAFIVADEAEKGGLGRPWTGADRAERISPRSIFWRGSLGETSPIPSPLIRLALIIVALIGIEEIVLGIGYHTFTWREYDPVIPRTFQKVHSETIVLHGIWAKLHGIVLLLVGGLGALFYRGKD